MTRISTATCRGAGPTGVKLGSCQSRSGWLSSRWVAAAARSISSTTWAGDQLRPARHPEAGDLIERRALADPVRGRLRLIELVHQHPFDVPEMSQDVLDRPARRRASGGSNRPLPATGSVRSPRPSSAGCAADQIHEFMLRTWFLASLRMPRSLIVILSAGPDRVHRAAPG